MHYHQEVLIDVEPDDCEWDSDSYETPDNIARYMAGLALPTDERILEPAAGTGQIAKYLPVRTWRPSVQCWEIKESWCVAGEQNAPHCWWLQQNALSDLLLSAYQATKTQSFDLIITNPPFSKGMEFIERSLQLLNPSNPNARLIFLLPADYFQTQGVGNWFRQLDCRIYQRHSIVGRVAYLKNGVSIQGRMRNDCIFDIRPGSVGDSMPETFVNA